MAKMKSLSEIVDKLNKDNAPPGGWDNEPEFGKTYSLMGIANGKSWAESEVKENEIASDAKVLAATEDALRVAFRAAGREDEFDGFLAEVDEAHRENLELASKVADSKAEAEAERVALLDEL